MSIRKKGGIRLAEAEDDSDESVSNDINDEEMRIKQQKEEAARKAKEEELWASFKKDTGLKAASKPTSSSKAVRLKVFCLFLFNVWKVTGFVAYFMCTYCAFQYHVGFEL